MRVSLSAGSHTASSPRSASSSQTGPPAHARSAPGRWCLRGTSLVDRLQRSKVEFAVLDHLSDLFPGVPTLSAFVLDETTEGFVDRRVGRPRADLALRFSEQV